MARPDREKVAYNLLSRKAALQSRRLGKSERLQHLQLPWPSNREIQAVVLNYRKNKISPLFLLWSSHFYKIRSFHIKHSILLPINIHSITTNKNFHDRLYIEFIRKRKGLSNKSLKLEITPIRVQTLTGVKSLKRDLLDSPLKFFIE